MTKKIYIDSDSLLYRSAHLTNHKDTAMDEALSLATEDEEGIYTVAIQTGGYSGAPSNGNNLEYHQDIEASSAEEAKRKYAKGTDTSYLVITDFKPANSLDSLSTAEEPNHIEEMKRIFHSMVRDIVEEVKNDALAKQYEVDLEPIFVLTVKPSLGICEGLEDNFRYKVMKGVTDENVKDYKHSRKGMEVPVGLNDIYMYVFNLPNTICISGVEADDVVVHYGTQGHIVCALDKDVLGSLEYAYNFGRGEWVENTPEEIAMFPYYQTITGDSSDGLRGAYRIGDKGARKALADCKTEYDMWKAVVTAYYSKNQTLEEAIATFRCVSMSQWTPEEGLVLWNPPKKEK